MTETPLTEQEVIDAYFLEHRAKVLDIAAFLDRIDRSQNKSKEQDFRIKALKECISELQTSGPNRAERILLLLSDVTKGPIEKAGTKGASGVPTPE